MSRHRRPVLTALVGLVSAVVLAGCSTGATAAPEEIAVSNAWVRPRAGPDRPAAGYLTITDPGPDADALIRIATPAANVVELHRTMTRSGMSGMEPVEAIHIPAGGTVTLEPGGFHLMLMGVGELAVGGTVELKLIFEKAGQITVTAEVRNG